MVHKGGDPPTHHLPVKQLAPPMTSTDIKLVFANEEDDKILGFTVRGGGSVAVCNTVEQLQEIGATAWATSVELLIWLSRTPEFWGEYATRATFRVWDWQAEQVREVTVPRRGCEKPLNRKNLFMSSP